MQVCSLQRILPLASVVLVATALLVGAAAQADAEEKRFGQEAFSRDRDSNVSGRVTGLPYYDKDENQLIQLGFSLIQRFADHSDGGFSSRQAISSPGKAETTRPPRASLSRDAQHALQPRSWRLGRVPDRRTLFMDRSPG